jgi:hypothetical protein
MSLHIGRISNYSPKSILLTNPVAERDTHLVPVQTFIDPKYPPKIEFIKDSNISYDIAIKKALNIYTGANNWCFWDVGGANYVLVFAEGGFNQPFFFKHPASSLELRIEYDGIPSFHPKE